MAAKYQSSIHYTPAEDWVSAFKDAYLVSRSICGDQSAWYVIPGDAETPCTRHSQHLADKETNK